THSHAGQSGFLAWAGIRRWQRYKNVAGTVRGNAGMAAKAERDTAREALQLMRQKWRIGRDDDDDRAAFLNVGGNSGGRIVSGDFTSNENSGDAKVVSRAVVALGENADSVSTVFGFDFARSCANAAL